MATKRQAMFLAGLMLITLTALSACGASSVPGGSAGTPGTSTATPDRVSIVIDEPMAPPPGETATPTEGTQPVVMLTDAALVRQLYATIFALPALAPDRACTAELGPHYTLAFFQGTATLVTVNFHRDGCWPVAIVGETLVREGSREFGQQLDQAILTATPPLSPDRLAIATAPHAGQAPQSALITSAPAAQQVYDAIIALPRANVAQGCPADSEPTYQLVFSAGEHQVPASVNETCQTVEVDGDYQWRGGKFTMGDQFRSMLQAVLAGITFASARPDNLAVAGEKGQTASYQPAISDDQLMLALYNQVFLLPETAPQPGCPPDSDKVAGTGTFVTLTFTQRGLPLVRIDTYQGSCSYVQLPATGQWLQGDQGFWDLVNRTLAP